MAHLCKYVSVLGVLTFLKLSSHVSGQMTAEAVYETLSYSIFKIKTDMENLKRRFEIMEEKGQRIYTTSFPQLTGRPVKEEDIKELKEYLSLQDLAIKKTLAAEKLLFRKTVESFEVKFAEFKSEILKDNSNISLVLETMKTTMMSNFGDIWTRIADITMMQKNDGNWNGWGSWSECSSTCGYGMERRERNCSSVTGHLCYGDFTEYQICKMALCPDCEAIYRFGTRYDGVYDISPDGQKSFPVYCDMTNGGWTLIQNRIDDSVPFNRPWSEYETGFGDLQGSHWLGLEKIHRLTRNGSQIRFDMELVNGSKVYAHYKSFIVDDASTAYTMHVNKSGYNGSIPELLSYHDGMKFSTLDRDNDAVSSGSCSQTFGYGGWWYYHCYRLGNLNGLYGIHDHTGFAYYDDTKSWYLKTASIKLKGF